MLIMRNRFLFHDALQVWWPEDPEGVYPLLSATPVVTVMQCSDAVARALMAYAFRAKPFHTLLVDVARSDEELWSGIHHTARNHINKAKRLSARVLVNEEVETAFRLIRAFIGRSRFRPPISAAEWREALACGDVFLVKHGEHAIAAQVVLVDYPHRARMLFSATVDRADPQHRRAAGCLPRLLAWSQLRYYREKGIRRFDFGGVDLDPTSPLYSITRFKLAFGGEVVRENTLRLAGHPIIRSVLRGVTDTKLLLGRSARGLIGPKGLLPAAREAGAEVVGDA